MHSQEGTILSDKINIALAGNPNCGKTTLFNELTGSNGYVGNWPGVTVEKKMATWKANHDVTFVDLPGIYSLSPYSPEEVVSRDYVVNDRPDAVINLIDVTNLERNLYLTTQVLEAGRPVVVGLNMCDLLKERGDVIDVAAISKMLGVPVVEVSALRNQNLDKLVGEAISAGEKNVAPRGSGASRTTSRTCSQGSPSASRPAVPQGSPAGTPSRSSSVMPMPSPPLPLPGDARRHRAPHRRGREGP